MVDENIGKTVVAYLRKSGYNVQSVTEEMRGASDEEVAKRAIEHRKVIITKDKDFGRIALAYNIPGLLLVRLKARQEEIARAIISALSEDLYHHVTVLEEGRTRKRRI